MSLRISNGELNQDLALALQNQNNFFISSTAKVETKNQGTRSERTQDIVIQWLRTEFINLNRVKVDETEVDEINAKTPATIEQPAVLKGIELTQEATKAWQKATVPSKEQQDNQALRIGARLRDPDPLRIKDLNRYFASLIEAAEKGDPGSLNDLADEFETHPLVAAELSAKFNLASQPNLIAKLEDEFKKRDRPEKKSPFTSGFLKFLLTIGKYRDPQNLDKSVSKQDLEILSENVPDRDHPLIASLLGQLIYPSLSNAIADLVTYISRDERTAGSVAVAKALSTLPPESFNPILNQLHEKAKAEKRSLAGITQHIFQLELQSSSSINDVFKDPNTLTNKLLDFFYKEHFKEISQSLDQEISHSATQLFSSKFNFQKLDLSKRDPFTLIAKKQFRKAQVKYAKTLINTLSNVQIPAEIKKIHQFLYEQIEIKSPGQGKEEILKISLSRYSPSLSGDLEKKQNAISISKAFQKNLSPLLKKLWKDIPKKTIYSIVGVTSQDLLNFQNAVIPFELLYANTEVYQALRTDGEENYRDELFILIDHIQELNRLEDPVLVQGKIDDIYTTFFKSGDNQKTLNLNKYFHEEGEGLKNITIQTQEDIQAAKQTVDKIFRHALDHGSLWQGVQGGFKSSWQKQQEEGKFY